MNDQVVLACQQLSKTFNDAGTEINVLQDLNLTIKAGESIAIIGASGSGKSTLLQLLGGLDIPSQGKILVAGESMSDVSASRRTWLRNRYIGFVYQFHHLLPEFSVLENVCIPLLLRGDSVKSVQVAAREILDKVGLAEREAHRLAELSGGERQRTAIARALVTRPVCVLADEPTGNLDPSTAERVAATMLELKQTQGSSLVVVTHDMKIAQKMDSVYELSQGKLLKNNKNN